VNAVNRQALLAEVERIEEAATYSAQTQFSSGKFWRGLNLLLGTAAAALAAVAGATGLSEATGPETAAIIALVAAALAAVMTTLNAAQRAEQSRVSANAYLALQGDARVFRTIDLDRLDPTRLASGWSNSSNAATPSTTPRLCPPSSPTGWAGATSPRVGRAMRWTSPAARATSPMATTVAQAFTEFMAKLKPTANQDQTIASRRKAIEDFLLARYHAGSNMPLIRTDIIGSAQRKTLIRPVDDIDVFAVFDDSKVWPTYQGDSRQLLYRVREALSEYRVETIGSRGQAVRLFYASGPNVDITPAFPVVGVLGVTQGYYIPRGDGGWQHTDPYVHNEFMSQRNQGLGNYLKPLVRLLKRWNNVHNKRLKSFHLELLTQAMFRGPWMRKRAGSSMRRRCRTSATSSITSAGTAAAPPVTVLIARI
jgi:hypothetical protein